MRQRRDRPAASRLAPPLNAAGAKMNAGALVGLIGTMPMGDGTCLKL